MANITKKRANTIGSISYIKERNLYKGRISLGIDKNGKRIRKTFYGHTEDEVTRKMFEYKYGLNEKSQNQKEFISPTNTSIQENILPLNEHMVSANDLTYSNVIEQNQKKETIYSLINSIVEQKLKLNIIQDSSAIRTLDTLKAIKLIYDIPIENVSEEILINYFAYITKYSKSVIQKICIMINQAFKEAIRLKIIVSNPMDYLPKPKSKVPDKKIRALTIEEEKKLIDILLNEDILYSQQLLISLFTGMRMGEINALHIEDVDMKNNIIHINKTISQGEKGEPILHNTTKTKAGSRDIPLPLEIKNIFIDALLINKNGPLFLHKNKMITTSQVYNELKRLLKRYDVIDKSFTGTITLHSCRHTYATRCIEGGMQPKVLQNLLGHTDITVTMNTYCDAFDKYKDENIKAAESYFKSIGISIQ